MEDELLLFETYSTKLTTREIFNKMNKYFEAHDIREYVIGIRTNGALTMLIYRSDFHTFVKEKSLSAIGTHSMIYRQTLVE